MDASSKEYTEAVPPPIDGIIGGIADAFNAARQVFSDLFRLFSLEIRRAGLALVWMVALGMMAAMLMVVAWLGLLGALALLAVSLGLSWISAMLVIALINLVMAVIVFIFYLTLSRNLLFPATRRQMERRSTKPNKP